MVMILREGQIEPPTLFREAAWRVSVLSFRLPLGFPKPHARSVAVFFEKDASGFFKRGQYFLNCVSSATELTFR